MSEIAFVDVAIERCISRSSELLDAVLPLITERPLPGRVLGGRDLSAASAR